MKGSDILLLGKTLLLKERWTYQSMGNMLKLSPSRIHDSVKSLIEAKLLVEMYDDKLDSSSIVPAKKNAIEFLLHGFKYIFPMKQVVEKRGVPAYVSAPDISFFFNINKKYVWPSDIGKESGIGIIPFHKNVPKIALEDSYLYLFFASLDCIRGESSREKKIGEDKLLELLQ